jgi:hypothetical protein
MSLNYELNLKTTSNSEKIISNIKKEFVFLEHVKTSNVYHLHDSTMTISCQNTDEEDRDIGFKRFGFYPDIELFMSVVTANQHYLDTLAVLSKIVVRILELESGDTVMTFNYGDLAIFKRIDGKLYINNQFCQEDPILIEVIKLGGELIEIEIPDLEDD